ncbi:HAD hydrolase family protein [bacterium]|nr:HAD hydrolase family protein [bacterium]
MTKLKIPKTIKYIISDFDGIMTDNCVYIDNNMNMTRKINFKDIIGLSRLKHAGIEVIYISGEKNAIIDTLTERFNLPESHQNIRIKIDVLKDIIKRYNLADDEYLYMGDDINDEECLKFCKIKITVPNAVERIKKIKKIQITKNFGGDGAFREVANCLLNL